MNSQQVQEQQIIRFYHWALEDGRQEALAGYPLLSRLERPGIVYLPVPSDLSLNDQLLCLRALTRRAHKYACSLLDQPLTADEEERIAYWHRAGKEGWQARYAARTRYTNQKLPYFDTREIMERTKASLSERLGGPVRYESGEGWRVRREFGDWRISFYFERNRSDLRYHHFLEAANKKNRVPLPPLGGADWLDTQRRSNVLRWMGLGGMHLELPCLFQYEMSDVIHLLGDCMLRSLDAAPIFLEGLSFEG